MNMSLFRGDTDDAAPAAAEEDDDVVATIDANVNDGTPRKDASNAIDDDLRAKMAALPSSSSSSSSPSSDANNDSSSMMSAVSVDSSSSFFYDADQNHPYDEDEEDGALGPESLHCAVFRQDVVAVERLLAAGVDPDEPDWAGSGDPPLLLAVTNGNVHIVRALCAAGCNVDARRVNGQSALMLSVVSRASRRSPRVLLGLLEELLAARADPNLREKLRGQAPLHALAKAVAAAADPLDPHLLAALRRLARVADVNAQDHRKRTALHMLASHGCYDPEPYNVLLEAKADPCVQNSRGDTPLVEYLEREQQGEQGELNEAVLRLLAKGVRHTTLYGEAALHVAARRNRAAAVRIALEAGADPRAQDLRGNTPLHLAAARGYTAVVAPLLDAPDTDVNAANRDGYTPLHVAVESGFVNVVDTLLAADGVDVTLVTALGQSVLDLARQEYRLRAHPQLAAMLAEELESRGSRGSRSPSASARSSRSSKSSSGCSSWLQRARASVSTLGDSSSDGDSCHPHFPAGERTPDNTPSSSSAGVGGDDGLSVNTLSTRGGSSSRRRRGQHRLAEEEEQQRVDYLGAQVTCLARVEPKYSVEDLLPAACRETSTGRAADIDGSLKEAADLMRRLCREDASVVEVRAPPNSGQARRPSSSLSSCGSRLFKLPANPYATLRGTGGDAGHATAVGTSPTVAPSVLRRTTAELDDSDLVVESLLAVAKSITEPLSSSEPECDQLDVPKDYELFERCVLFGGGAHSQQQAPEPCVTAE